MDTYMLSYRYLLVLAGQTAADRLPTFLAHSGAVILLQQTDFLYPFSARLQPWVHYVPIAYNGADVVDKVRWLKGHPDMAFRLAQNARNFGRSYLRYEDYHCYIAAALMEVATVADASAIEEWFDPRPLRLRRVEPFE